MNSRPVAALVLGLILAAGLALRLWGLGFGLPNLHCRPDEGVLVHKALAMGQGDLNPHFFNYPSLHFYLLAGLYGAYYAAGQASGAFAGLEEFERQYFTDPSTWYLLGRLASALFGAASVALVYLLGRHRGGERAGLMGAAFLAGAFLHVRDSHFLTVDVPATFYLLGALLLLWRYVAGSGRRCLWAAAVLLGLASSTKYNLGLFLPCVALAAWWGPSGAGAGEPSWKRTGAAMAVVGAAFLAGSPFVLLDFPAFWRDLAYERAHFATGHGLDLGRGWSYFLSFSLPYGLGWPLLLAGMAGCLWLSRERRREDWILLSGILAYYAVAGSGRSVFLRYALPLVPMLCLTAGLWFSHLTRRWRPVWAGLAALGLVAPTAWAAFQHDRLISRTDTRVLAATWIEENLSSRSRIAMLGSGYGYPQLRPTREWLQERLEDQRAAGLEARRLARALSLRDYPPEPAYYVVELHPRDRLEQRSVWPEYSTESLARQGVRWVLVHEHPLPYSRADSAFQAQLDRDAQLVYGIDPFVQSAGQPVYDPIDAYYAPVAGLAAVERPGPAIRIYRLEEAVR